MRAALPVWLRLGLQGLRRVQRDDRPPLPVLVASERDEDQRTLQLLLRGTRWSPVPVNRWRDAAELVERYVLPVVLCDRDLPGMEWQPGIGTLRRPGYRPSVILLSGVADPYLWDELVQAGGFDILTRPFRRDQTLAMIDFAYTHWKTEWPNRQPQLMTPFRTA